jgi:signal transduction histidine kinase
MELDYIPVFSQLRPELKQELNKKLTQVDIKPGGIIIREGDIDKTIYFITDGIVKIIRIDSASEEQVLAVLHRGEFFGEVSFIDEKPRSASVIAQTNTKLLKLEYSQLESLLQNYPTEMLNVLMNIFTSITERLRQTNDHLMRLIQISHTAQKASEELKRNILGIISHELRTPLTVIKSSSQLLQFDELTPQQRQFLEMIDRQSTHLNRLVDGLLTLSSIQHGRLTIRKAQFNIVAAIEQAIIKLHSSITERGINIIKEFSQDEIYLYGDPIMISEMVVAVTDNAIKFNKKGGAVTIKVRWVSEDEAENMGWQVIPNECEGVIELTVSDTGIGILPDDFQNIFKPFWQADISATRQHGGAGIGLSFTKEIVLAHQGRIELDSTLNQGSTFRIYIPSLVPSGS